MWPRPHDGQVAEPSTYLPARGSGEGRGRRSALCIADWLLQYAGTMLLFLMFPLVSPAFLLYLVVKHLVDLHNFRLFYTAREPQPMLLRTAVQIAVSASVLAQASLTLVYVTTEINDWRESSYRQVTNMNTTT